MRESAKARRKEKKKRVGRRGIVGGDMGKRNESWFRDQDIQSVGKSCACNQM